MVLRPRVSEFALVSRRWTWGVCLLSTCQLNVKTLSEVSEQTQRVSETQYAVPEESLAQYIHAECLGSVGSFGYGNSAIRMNRVDEDHHTTA